MNQRLMIAGLLLLAFGAVGCTRKVVHMNNPTAIAAGDYDRVFDAAVAELRDRKFVVTRQDRRFGQIQTSPRIASSVLEPWETDNTTRGQSLSSTLNMERRIVQVTLIPVGENADTATEYHLGVKVQVERRKRPPQQLTTSALGGVSSKSSRQVLDRRIVTEDGPQESYWKPLTDDPYLEQRLIKAFIDRAAHGPHVSSVEIPAPQ